MSQDDRHSLLDDAEQLRALLLAERARHADAIAQRDGVIAQHAGVISVQHDTIAAQQQQTVEKLEHQLARLLRKQYGPQKERIDPNQLTLFSAEEIEQLAAELQNGADGTVPDDESRRDDGTDGDDDAARSGSGQKPKRNSHGRNRLPDDLPREVVLHELSDEERVCPCCGKPRTDIGCETSEQLEFVPGSLKVIEHRRQKCACKECKEHVAIATNPRSPVAEQNGVSGKLFGCRVDVTRFASVSGRRNLAFRIRIGVVVTTFHLASPEISGSIRRHVYPAVFSKQGWETTRLVGAGRIVSHRRRAAATGGGMAGQAG